MNELAIAATDMTIRGSPPGTEARSSGSNAVVVPISDRRAQEGAGPDLKTAEKQPEQNSGEKEIDAGKVAQAVHGVNDLLKSSNVNHIKFSMHEETKRMMVQIIDEATQEVIRTIPSKELLDLAAAIGDLVGTLIDERT